MAPGITASDQRKNRGHSSSGTPSRSLITWSARGTASSDTTSTGVPASMPSTSARVRARTPSSRDRTKVGRNPGCTRLRYRVCAGGSVCIMVGGVAYSLPISKTMIPRPEQKVSGSRETVTTSACRLATQNPRDSLRTRGASARNRA